MRTTPNPKIISWAIKRSGKTIDDFTSISKKAPLWLTGEVVPTIKQMQKIAHKTHVLLPYFYDDKIPNFGLQISDFRTKDDKQPKDPSPELYETINAIQSRQDWLIDYLKENDCEPLNFVGCCNHHDSTQFCLTRLHELLQLEVGWAKYLSCDMAVRKMREVIESTRIYVCAGSYLGNNNRRHYNVDEFRGFVLTDKIAPIIFINTADAKTAQLFTLVHEVAHLLFDESGVDDATYDNTAEIKCNTLAAEYLVPTSVVYQIFNEYDNKTAIKELKNFTKTSELVCLRRARELRCITNTQFFAYYKEYQKHLEKLLSNKNNNNDISSGATYYNLKKNHLGKLFPETVFLALKEEKLLYTDAYELTDMNANTFSNYYKKEGLFV